MKNSAKKFNTWQSVRLIKGKSAAYAVVSTCIADLKLDQHLEVSYEAGRKELAKLMLRLGKMPAITYSDRITVYALNGFLD